MLRKRLPNQEFSPRLLSTIEASSDPLPITDATPIFKEAGVTCSAKLLKLHSGSWYDTIITLENLAKRKCTTAESAVTRTTIDALCSRSTASFKEKSPQTRPSTEDTGSCRTVEPLKSQCDEPFFQYKKFTIADHEDARASIRKITNLFRDQSKFVSDALRAGKTMNQIIRILDASIRSSINSPKTILMYAKHTIAFHDFLVEEKVPSDEWEGELSVFHLYSYLERPAGTTVPATIRCALRAFATALHINWDLDTKALSSICQKPDREPKQAPMLKLEHIFFFEKCASNRDLPFPERLYAANFALMCHASLRFDDTKTISDLQIDGETIEGRINAPKVLTIDAKKFFCAKKGFTTDRWVSPIIRFRDGYALSRTYPPSFLFPSISENGKTVLETQAKKFEVLKAFRSIIEKSGDPHSTIYTLHSPRNWYTSVAAQLGWGCKAQTTLGRWGDASKMPNRYNRQKGTVELSVRSDIVERIRRGWTPSDAQASIQKPPKAQRKHALRSDDAYLESTPL